MRVLAQPLLNQNDVMEGGNDGEQEGGAQKFRARDPDPADWPDLKQQNEKHCADLTEVYWLCQKCWDGSCADPAIANRTVLAARIEMSRLKTSDRVLPRNLVQDGEHKKHRAQQKFVGDRVEILPEQGLLMESSCRAGHRVRR